jgi:hypothetical protein
MTNREVDVVVVVGGEAIACTVPCSITGFQNVPCADGLGFVKKYVVPVYISSSGHLWPIFNRETLKIAQLFLGFLSFRSTQSDLNLSVFMYHVFLYEPLGTGSQALPLA